MIGFDRELDRLDRNPQHSNHYQHEVLNQLGVLTSASDPVYDNSGSSVARPVVDYYFSTHALLKEMLADYLIDNIPREIQDKQAVAMIKDARYSGLPAPLKRYLDSHYQPYNGDIFLWGASFGKGETSNKYLAIESGKYFVEPASRVGELQIEVDGRRIRDQVFTLDKGIHSIKYKRLSMSPFYLLWLPRNQTTYTPRPGLRARFSTIF